MSKVLGQEAARWAKYVAEMRDALRYPGAHALYFPENRAERRNGNFRLAREVAPALDGFPEPLVQKEIGGLYGAFIVANSLDTTGAAVDADEWFEEIRRHRGNYRKEQA
jgi:hypothetical protein